MWVWLLAIVIFLCSIHILFNYNARARMLKKIPGPRLDFIVGNCFNVIRPPVELMELGREFAKRWDGIYRVWIYPLGGVFIYNPDDIEKITSNMKYNEKSIIYNLLRPWLGDGLLISKGSKWQNRRKILTPTFHFNILRQFCEIIMENSHHLVETLKETAGQPTDVVPILSEFTLTSICETAMGSQLDTEITASGKSYKKAILELADVFLQRFMRVYLYADFIFNLTPLKRKQTKLIEEVHSFTTKVIKDRKEYVDKYGINTFDNLDDESFVYKKKRKTAMLDLLINAEKEGLIDHAGVQEEVDTFMFEGHDTTAAGLNFCFMLLANHKDIQDKIVLELHEIFGDTDRPVKMEDLPKMKYMELCIKESLRLYPPVHFISRSLNEDTLLSNYKVPKGTLCHIPIYDLHHREDLFPNPEQFDPNRFLPENSVGRHPYAYIPFSAGPRNCIGQKFAMMEMKVATAQVLRNFELLPVTQQADIRVTAHLILRNDGPIKVTFIKRK